MDNPDNYKLSKVERAMYEDKALKLDNGSHMESYEVISTLPKCYGAEPDFEILPYESRIDS